jgi:DNA-binding NarL/FixJ family response regulator
MSENGRSGENEARLRVMLCHEVPVMRGGLRAIINAERDMDVVAEADGINEALKLIDGARPDVIVTDLSMDCGDGSTRYAPLEQGPVRRVSCSLHGIGEFFTRPWGRATTT